ncbi:MAG: metallophosphoesterase family protein [Bacteroidota bacterium]
MKTIAVISDIHGNILALEEVVADMKRRHVDAVFNLGDHLSGPLWPKETIQFLMRQEWIQISGNHDRQLVKQYPATHGLSDGYAFKAINDIEKEWLRALPATFRADERIFLFHGTPSSDSEYLLETVERGRARLASQREIKLRLGNAKSPVMLCGHTHIQRVVRCGENTVIVNPGSVGLPAYKDALPEPHVMESGSPHARYALLHFENKCIVELIAVPYDFQKAAAQARKNDRPDWAIGLQLGYITE